MTMGVGAALMAELAADTRYCFLIMTTRRRTRYRYTPTSPRRR
jgi:dihydropteroate synthase